MWVEWKRAEVVMRDEGTSDAGSSGCRRCCGAQVVGAGDVGWVLVMQISPSPVRTKN